jgi:DnaJ-domain-containing protein 1
MGSTTIEEIFRTDQTNLQAAPAVAYETLGCGPSDTLDSIKKRYRSLAGIFHPDALSGKVLPVERI